MHNPWNNPFDQLESMLERMHADMRGDWGASLGGLQSITVDVMDDGDAFTVVADIPGVEKEAINLSYHDGVLTFTAESTTGGTTDDEDAQYVKRERRHTHLERSVRLPEPVDDDAATATYSNGVLTVTLPKLDSDDEEGVHIDIE